MNKEAETKRPGDLVLSEQFHRLKRTALIFCSVIVVTIIPGVDFNAASQSVWAPFKGVSHAWALLLLYIGACYYALGFLGEYIAAHRLNAELLIDRTGNHLAEVLKEADRVASAALETLNSAVNGLPGVNAPAIMTALRQDMAQTLAVRFPPVGFAAVNAAFFELHQRVQGKLNALDLPIETVTAVSTAWEQMRGDAIQLAVQLAQERQNDMLAEIRQGPMGAGSAQPLETFLAAVSAQQTAVDELRRALPGLRRPLATLNVFGTARTLTFWLWEGLAVLAMWLFATGIFLWNAPELFGMVWLFQA